MNLNTNILCFQIIVFAILAGSYTFGQTSFPEDSLQIVNNSRKLLKKPEVKKEAEIVAFLSQKVEHQNRKTEDFIQFTLGRLYFMRQNIPAVEKVVKRNLEDDYNENHSDAKFYNMQGVVLSLKSKYEAAISSFLTSADKYARRGDKRSEHTIYNNVANIYLALGDHHSAYNYSSKCFNVFQKYPDDPNFLSLLGVLAVCENNLGMLDSAEVHIEKGLDMLENTTNIKGSILLNYAKSELEFKKGNYYKAIPFARKSLTLSENYNLKEYQVISSIVLMKVHNQLEEFKIALSYGKSAQEMSTNLRNLSMQHSVYEGLARAQAGINDFEAAYDNISIADSLKNIDRNQQNKKSMDSLLVQFESLANKNKILGQQVIIASQNHVLEKKNSTLILISFTGLILILFFVGLFLFNRQRLRLIENEQEVKLINAVSATEEEERNRLSSLLHDGLAAELTALKLELERHDGVSQRSLAMLEKAHGLTRRISHNLSPYMIDEKGLVEALAYMVSNNNVNKNLFFYSNTKEKLSLSSKVSTILFRSAQELLQNAMNHSKATEIVVQVMKNGDILTISIEDDGIGMDTSVINDSIGLGSLKKRIELINGELNIDSSPSNGTSAFIHFKLKKS